MVVVVVAVVAINSSGRVEREEREDRPKGLLVPTTRSGLREGLTNLSSWLVLAGQYIQSKLQSRTSRKSVPP